MSVWKKLNKQDSFVTSYVAKKRWTITSEELETRGVKLLPAYSTQVVIQGQTERSLDCVGVFQAEYIGSAGQQILRNISTSRCNVEFEAEIVLEK